MNEQVEQRSANVPVYAKGTTRIVGWVPRPEQSDKEYVVEGSPDHQRFAALRGSDVNPRTGVSPMKLGALNATITRMERPHRTGVQQARTQ